MPDMQNDDQFIQRRMLLAAVLSALVMGAYIYFAPPSAASGSRTQSSTECGGDAGPLGRARSGGGESKLSRRSDCLGRSGQPRHRSRE